MNNLAVYLSPVSKRRVGKPYDGGYVICDIPGSYDCLISGGIAGDISFEQSLLSLQSSPIPCYAFDGTISSLPTVDPRIQFIRKNLGDIESDTLTNLRSTIEPYTNIFMKIDIEGHEFKLFPALEGLLHKVKQLVVEIHSPGSIRKIPSYFPGLTHIQNEHMFALLEQLNKTHTLVHVHPNNGCETHMIGEHVIPDVFECTYLRNEFVPKRIPSKEAIPTSLDMPNIKDKYVKTFSGYPFIVEE